MSKREKKEFKRKQNGDAFAVSDREVARLRKTLPWTDDIVVRTSNYVFPVWPMD